jgi:dethiobiotin synthetase
MYNTVIVTADGKSLIKDAVLTIKYFDKKTLNYLSIIFNISKEEFRCYKQSLSENPYGIF